MKQTYALFFFLLCFVLLETVAVAQWSSDPSVNTPITVATNGQWPCVIAGDGTGGAIVAWVDYRNGTTNSDIYAQRINNLGEAEWTTDGIEICTAPSYQTYPAIVEDGVGGAIITWEDSRNGGDQIFAQRINTSGIVQWVSNGVPIGPAGLSLQQMPSIISDGTGGAIITWLDYRNGEPADIYAQLVNSSGVNQWTSDGVAICTAAHIQSFPLLVHDGEGGAIITWIDPRSDSTGDIYSQRVNHSGIVQWTTNGVAICTDSNSQTIAGLVSDGTGGAIISWNDGRGFGVYAQRVNSSGIVQWAVDGLYIGYGREVFGTSIVSDNAGGAIITFNANSNSNIYAVRVDGSGVKPWSAPICTAPNSQYAPTIASNGIGGAIITWYDYRSSSINIYAQSISDSGVVQWLIDGVAISTAQGSQLSPKIIGDGVGGAIIVWSDSRFGAGSDDIYVQNVNRHGQLGTNSSVKLLSPPNNAINLYPVISLRWIGADEAIRYHVEVSNDSTFSSIIYSDTNVVDTTILLDTLGVSTTRFWRVRPIFPEGTGNWSSTWKFTTTQLSDYYYAVNQRWNLISVPLTVADNSKSALFPTSSSDAFTFSNSGGYNSQSLLVNGVGYWLKFGYSQLLPFQGGIRTLDTVTISEGWNIIGSISQAIQTSAITSLPPGLVTSQFFGYSYGYIPSSTIEPGKGYWVKVNQAGKLILSSTLVSATNTIKIVQTNEFPPSAPSDEITTSTGVIPKEYSLGQNYPNPFNPATVIGYQLSGNSFVSLKVYNILGEEVATLVNGIQDAGFKSISWDASTIPSGVYYYRLQAKDFSEIKKMVLAR